MSELCSRKFLALFPEKPNYLDTEDRTEREERAARRLQSQAELCYKVIEMIITTGCHCMCVGTLWYVLNCAPDDNDECVCGVIGSGWCPWPCKAGYLGLYI